MYRLPSTYKITGHSEENLIKSSKKTAFQRETAEHLRHNETARNQDIQRQLLFILTNSDVGVWQSASPSTTVSTGRAVSVALPLEATIHLLSVTCSSLISQPFYFLPYHSDEVKFQIL